MELKRKKKLREDRFFSLINGLLCLVLFCFSMTVMSQTMSIVATDNAAAEGPANSATFTITKSAGGFLAEYTVSYTTSGTATNGTDYPLLSGSIIVPGGAGVTSVDLVVPINEDFLIEGDETITITLAAGFGYFLSPLPADNTATATITDNDTGTVTVTASTPTASEAGPVNGVFTVTLSGNNNTGSVLTVNYILNSAGATATVPPATGADYSVSVTPIGTITFNATQLSRPINIIPVDDIIFEGDETVIFEITGVSSSSFTIGAPDKATVTILDNDCAAGTTAPPINGNPKAFCDNSGGVSLNTYHSGTAPAGAPLRWSLNANPTVAGDLLPASPTVTTSNTYYALYWSASGSCGSPTSPVTITFSTSPSSGTPLNTNSCSDNAFGTTTVDLDNQLSGTVSPGNWAFTSGPEAVNPNGSNVVNFNNRANGTYVYTYTTNNAVAPCTNKSTAVSITVTNCDPCVAGNVAPVLDATTPTVFCDAISVSLNDYTNSTPPPGTTLKWSTSSTLTNTSAHLNASQVANPLPGTYYGFFWDAVNLCASPALQVQLTLNTTPANVQGVDGERCGNGPVTLTASSSTPNSTFNWYTALTGGTLAGTGASFSPNLSQTTNYFLEATRNGCATSPRIQVVATVVPAVSAGTPSDASACSVAANGLTIIDLDDRLAGEDAGSWAITTDPSGSMTILPGNIVNFQGRPDGNYVFTFTTAGAQAPCVNQAAAVTISVNNCDVDSDLDGLFDGPEANLGTDPNNPDTDGDGINDGTEVGGDVLNPLDGDSDGIIDALDSNVLDTDGDGVVDQLDPANANPCIPNNTNSLCDTDGDGITDGDEIANGSDPLDACSPNLTPDCEPNPIDLEITKIVENLNAIPGDSVTFSVAVNNLSDSRVLGIKIAELLENGFVYVSHTASLGNYDPVVGQWDIFEMQPLASATLNLVVDVTDGGNYSNTVTLLESFPIDNNPSNDSATITLNIDLPEGVDLLVEKSALSKRPLVGDQVVFTIKATNKSIESTMSNIQILDVNANDIGFVYISHIADTGTYDPSTGIWDVPQLIKDQEAKLLITVQVPTDGTFPNTARLIRSSPGDSNPANNESTVVVWVNLPNPAEDGFVFNQFSPNSDGTNDFLKIRGIANFVNPSIEIYNRYGHKVFEARNMTDDNIWDGTWKNEQVPDGTYYYLLNLGDSSEIKKGWIQLIR